MKTKLNSALIATQKAFIALILGVFLHSTFLHSNLQANDAKNPCGALLCLLGGQTSGECKKYYEYYTIGITKEVSKECKYRADCINYTLPLKQLAHLKNCKLEGAPANAQVDTNLANSYGVTSFTQNLGGKINEMSGMDGECTKSALNRVESKVIGTTGTNPFKKDKIYAYRINPNPTKTCQVLASQTYSAIKISYTCDRKFYHQNDWNNGYEIELVSKALYDTLESKDRGFYYSYKNIDEKTYKNLPPNKRQKVNCREVSGDNASYTQCTHQEIITNYYKKNYIKKDCWVVEERKFG